jgi:hypothetical protein
MSNRRVRLERDEWAEAPDYDAQCPVVFLPYLRRNSYALVTVGKEYLPDEDRIHDALGRFGWEGALRWLSCFYGPVVKTHDGSNRDGVYVEVATTAWCESMGVANNEDFIRLLKEEKASDFEHYLDGDVFILVPERLETWVRLKDDGSLSGEDEQRWEDDPDQHSVGGFYGKDWAVEAAEEDFYDDDVVFDIVEEDGTLIKTVNE